MPGSIADHINVEYRNIGWVILSHCGSGLGIQAALLSIANSKVAHSDLKVTKIGVFPIGLHVNNNYCCFAVFCTLFVTYIILTTPDQPSQPSPAQPPAGQLVMS